MADPQESAASPDDATPISIQCRIDAGFQAWFERAPVCLAVTTYQGGKLMFIGWNGNQVSLHARSFRRAMGLDVRDGQLVVASRTMIHWFANAELLAEDYQPDRPPRYDGLYLHRADHHTGDIFAHDIALGADHLYVVNTRFSCLCTPSRRYSFAPVWQPPFVTELAPEDRCHLNGLALRDGRPYAVTALGVSDTPRGWRPGKAGGGIVMTVADGRIVASGLSMPHSPRWHGDALWVLDSGRGRLLRIDPVDGAAAVAAALPGYLRGLAFCGEIAIVGLCKIREKRVFGGLPIEAGNTEPVCGLALVDTRTGAVTGMFEFTAGVEEIYDIRVMPGGMLQPDLLEADHETGAEAFTAPEFAYWIGPAAEAESGNRA